MGAGRLNVSRINRTLINGSDFMALVNSAHIAINVNKSPSARINRRRINTIRINGLVSDNNVRATQTHVATVNDAVITLTSSSPAPVMIFSAIVHNAVITLTSEKVFVSKAAGGSLFVTIREPDNTVHRFSFDGVKA